MTADRQNYQEYLSLVESLRPFYVFAFGSLIWAPDFNCEKKMRARVEGFHRRFGMWSVHYRGTIEKPGLVVGLDHGGHTVGACLQVAEADRDAVAKKLWEREMISAAYTPCALPVLIEGENKVVQALAFTLDAAHKQYVHREMPLSEQAKIIATSAGANGTNRDYFFNMIKSLEEMNIIDEQMEALKKEFEKLTGGKG
ncbi:MAG: gamma-glutamylcyclotransferase [Hydrotalea sp.]|nr:gamma-glutamylcyclotransferase [Hydrotalea sp.]